MRKVSIALAAATTLALAACGGGDKAENNVSAVEDLNLADPLADNFSTDMNMDMDMNATDLNAADMNMTTDLNTTNTL